MGLTSADYRNDVGEGGIMQGKIVKCDTCGGAVRLIAPKGDKRVSVTSCFREEPKK